MLIKKIVLVAVCAVLSPFVSTPSFSQHDVADPAMGISYFGGQFHIGRADDSAIANFTSGMYYRGQMTDRQWKQERNKRSWWNCSGELVRDAHADLAIDSIRNEQKRFVPGYRIVVKQSYSSDILHHLNNIVLIYEHDILIRLTADVDSNFYKGMQHYSGVAPAMRQENDTIPCTVATSGVEYQFILTDTRYTWTQGDNKTEIRNVDKLNDKCKKYTLATIVMTDMARYEAYRELVRKNEL